MVTITEGAGALLQEMQSARPARGAFRMIVESGELVVGATPAAADDEVLFHAGVPVLRLSTEAAHMLSGCTIGTQDTPQGTTLTIVTANAGA